MSRVHKLPQAQEDLLDIWVRIAADSPFQADRFLDLLDDRMRLLADTPGIGRSRAELAPGLRGLPVGNYVIFYRQVSTGIETCASCTAPATSRLSFTTPRAAPARPELANGIWPAPALSPSR